MIKIYEYGAVADDRIFARTSSSQDVSGIVAPIIDDVRIRGDIALREYTEKFDKAEIDSIEIPSSEIEEAFGSSDPDFIRVLEKLSVDVALLLKIVCPQSLKIALVGSLRIRFIAPLL